MDTLKITGEDSILCLSCGVDSEGVILYTSERPDLIGEECDQCERVAI